jgi:hypothetical protein
MKKLLIALMLTTLMVLTACTSTEPNSEPTPIIVQPDPVASEPEPESEPVETYTITSETEAKIEERFTTREKYAISQTYKAVEAGEHHTFAVAMRNIFTKEDNFLVALEFKETQDKFSNPISGIEESDVKNWISLNEFEEITLQPGETHVQPVIIKALDIDGKPAPSGTYVFELNVYNQDNFGSPQLEFSGPIELAVQVI